jgi:hypothetical protein
VPGLTYGVPGAEVEVGVGLGEAVGVDTGDLGPEAMSTVIMTAKPTIAVRKESMIARFERKVHRCNIFITLLCSSALGFDNECLADGPR